MNFIVYDLLSGVHSQNDIFSEFFYCQEVSGSSIF